jgi:hypothetical protein
MIHGSTLVGGITDVLPYMLSHYEQMGIEDMAVHARADPGDEQALDAIAAVARERHIEVRSRIVAPWHFAMNTVLHAACRSQHSSDWFVVADQDEFQLYPDGLGEAVKYCDRHGFDYIEGCLVDRISSSGRLVDVDCSRPLWGQYPIGCIASAVVAGSCINKIVAARGGVRLSNGQHHALSGRGCPVGSLYIAVHHFKWTTAVLGSLVKRVNLSQYSAECQRLLGNVCHDDAFDLDDDRLLCARCEPDYPFIEKLAAWRASARYFSQELTAIAVAGLDVLHGSSTAGSG